MFNSNMHLIGIYFFNWCSHLVSLCQGVSLARCYAEAFSEADLETIFCLVFGLTGWLWYLLGTVLSLLYSKKWWKCQDFILKWNICFCWNWSMLIVKMLATHFWRPSIISWPLCVAFSSSILFLYPLLSLISVIIFTCTFLSGFHSTCFSCKVEIISIGINNLQSFTWSTSFT